MTAAAAAPSRRVGAKPPARIQRKAMASGLAPRDSREREAEIRGEAFARGGQHLSRGLSRAAAAGFVDPGSAGEALPIQLKADLESAFDAGFGDVRIHRDAAAHSAARRAGARAFASGADIYFGEGAFDPASPAGRSLIGHEIAHVLQQAGRSSHGGRMRVHRVFGAGELQCAPFPDYATLKAAHAPGSTNASRASFDGVAAHIEGLLKAPDPKAALDAYAAATIPGLKGLKWPFQAESLLYDACKLHGLWDRAAELIERNDFLGGNRINTIGSSPELIEAIERRNGGWAVYTKAFTSVSWLKAYEADWLARFEQFLMGGDDTGAVALSRSTAKPGKGNLIFDHVTELNDDLFDYRTTSNNEWIYNALLLMLDLDGLRRNGIAEMAGKARTESAGKMSWTFEERRKRAALVVQWGADLPKSARQLTNLKDKPNLAAISTALQPYLKGLGDRVSAIGRKAGDLFQAPTSIEDMLAPKGDDAALVATLTARRDLAGRLGAQQGIPAQLAEMLVELNRNSEAGDRSIAPYEFRERAKAWGVKLDDLVGRVIGQERLKAFRAGNGEDVLAWIAIEAFIRRLRSHLAWTAMEDSGVANTPRPAVWTADEVAFELIRIADWVYAIAKPLAWDKSVAAANVIIEAHLEARSVLAIRSFDDGDVFKQTRMSAETMIDQAKQDTGASAIRGLEPLTLYAVTLFYHALWIEDLTAHLRLLTPHGNAAEQKVVNEGRAVPYLVSDAHRLINVDLPQRWYTGEVHYAPKKGSTEVFRDVLNRHPAYRDLYYQKRPASFSHIVPLAVESPLWVWFIPPYDRLIASLRTSQLFRALVVGGIDARRAKAALNREEKLKDSEWFSLLSSVIATKTKDPEFAEKQLPAILDEMNRVAMGEHDRAIADFRNAFIWAMRRDRQLIARRQIARLSRYAADHHDKKAIFDTIDEFRRFIGANGVLNDFDREIQLALLMLEVAPELRAALRYEETFSIVFPMLGLTEPALARAQQLLNYRVDQRPAWLPDHENSDSWISGRIVDLNAAVAHLQAVRTSVQKSRGFRADATSQQIIPYVKLSSPLEIMLPLVPRYGGFLGDPSARGYRITSIKKSFIYHPSYGDAPSQFEQAKSGYGPPKFVEPDDATAIDETVPLLDIDVIEFVPPADKTKKGQWRTVRSMTVTAKDQRLFEDLYNGISWQGFASAMGNVQAGIEAILEFYLDAAELLPGVGPAIAAARISAAIAEFLASDDYQAVIDMAGKGLITVVSGLFDSLSQHVNADELILLLLFGDPRLELVLARSTLGQSTDKKPAEAPAASGGKFGTLKKIIEAFKRLGRGLFKALRMLVRYVERPMQDVRAFVSTRPLVAFIFQFAADHIFEIVRLVQGIAGLIGGVQDSGEKFKVTDIESLIREQQDGMAKRVQGMMAALQTFKLPHTIVDIKPAIAMVLGMAEALIIKRAGFGGKILSLALKDSGAYDLINSHFAAAIVDAGADPNIYWRDVVLPKIESRFDEARGQLVEKLNEKLSEPAFAGLFTPIGAPEPTKVEADPTQKFQDTEVNYMPPAGEAEIQPEPSADRPLIPRPAEVPRVDAGTPLPQPVRRRVESQLGQDFGHVRLHEGQTGERMTRAFGADALTGGSHIFVRPGKLDRTLEHELVHVVQQTGARPLGRPHGTLPVAAHPERGLDWRPRDEAAAGEIASAMRSGSGKRLGGAPGRAAGLQPTGVNWFTVARFMRQVSNLPEVLKNAEAIDATKASAAVSSDVEGAITKIIELLKAPVANKASKKFRNPGPFDNAIKWIENRLKAADMVTTLTAGAKQVAQNAMEPLDAKAGEQKHLSAHEFARHFEAYILAKSGIGVAIKLKSKSVPVRGRDFEAVDLADPVEYIALLHVHLPLIDGRNPLWGDALDNTWKAATPDYKDKMRSALKSLLDAKGVQIGIWPLFGSVYRFSLMFTKEAEDYLKALQGARPNPVPVWTEYVKTDKDTPSGYVGLRLAHYSHKSQSNPAPPGRESHHLTQFLVGEFFANKNDAKAFPAGRAYPGVFLENRTSSTSLAAGPIGTINNRDGGGGDAINVKDTSQGRGDAMPTISLAAVTHQKGKLHVTPEPDETGKKKTQGAAMQNEFKRHLAGELTGTDTKKYNDYIALKGRDVVAAEIYRATQATYATVEHHMSTQLHANMAQIEFDYYCDIAKGTPQDIADPNDSTVKTPAQIAFRQELDKIPALAKQHNREGMIKFGWDVSK